MTCDAHPPAEIQITITLQAPDNRPVFVGKHANGSDKYVSSDGHLYLGCLKHAVNIRMTVSNPGVYFYNDYGKNAVSFDDDAAGTRRKPPVVGATHHQFRGGVSGGNGKTIKFRYRGEWNGGSNDPANPQVYAQSRYGLYFGDAGGFLLEVDPIVDNGSTPPSDL